MDIGDDLYGFPPTQLGIPPEIRLDIIRMLNQTLACTVDLRSQVRQACWNTKGKDSSVLHALFATMLGELVTGHVRALVERFGRYAATLRNDIVLATDVEDAGSAALYTDISRGVDKQLWLLETYAKRAK